MEPKFCNVNESAILKSFFCWIKFGNTWMIVFGPFIYLHGLSWWLGLKAATLPPFQNKQETKRTFLVFFLLEHVTKMLLSCMDGKSSIFFNSFFIDQRRYLLKIPEYFFIDATLFYRRYTWFKLCSNENVGHLKRDV